MAKPSTSKKVARVARAGAGKRRVRERPKMGFGMAIFVILLLGTLLVFYSRNDRTNSAAAAEPPIANQDHWHVAYGVYVCDHFLPPVTDAGEDRNGIHTHGDGIIHTHPFVAAAAGTNARLKVFADQTGMKLGSDSITMPDGTEYKNGFDCNGKPANVYVYRWSDAFDPNATAEVFTNDFGQIRIKDDRSAITFAVVPEGTEVPRPDSVPTLNSLSDLGTDQSGATASSVPIDPSQLTVPSTAPGTPSPSDPTASSVPPASTPTPSESAPAAPTSTP